MYAVHVCQLKMKSELIGTELLYFGEIFPLCHLSVHPKAKLYYHLSLTQCAFHLVRMQLS